MNIVSIVKKIFHLYALWILIVLIASTHVIPVYAITTSKYTQILYRRVRVQISGSRNWAGYSSVNGTFTTISGTWTLPTISPSGHTATDATWVGIGGIRSSDLIQSGTQDVITKNGQVISQAWIEMLPYASEQIPVTVSSGNSVTVTITNIGGNQWQFTFRNNTTGQGYQTIQSYASSESSAEWIEESPSNGAKILPLDNFGTISLRNCSTDKNGETMTIAQSEGQSITMLGAGGKQLALPSPIGVDGASFTITRTNAASAPPVPQYDQNPGTWRRQGQGLGNPSTSANAGQLNNSYTTSPTLTAFPSFQGFGLEYRQKLFFFILFGTILLFCLYFFIDDVNHSQQKGIKNSKDKKNRL